MIAIYIINSSKSILLTSHLIVFMYLLIFIVICIKINFPDLMNRHIILNILIMKIVVQFFRWNFCFTKLLLYFKH
jgi:hypothetical protein